MDTMDKFNALWSIQLGIYENIKFADSKALALGAINAGVLGGLNALGVFDLCHSLKLVIPAVVSFFCLSLSFAFILLVVKPRKETGQNNNSKSCMDPNKISKLDKESFKGDVLSANEESLLNELAHYIKERSDINEDKYDWLGYTIYATFIGWGSALFATVMSIILV